VDLDTFFDHLRAMARARRQLHGRVAGDADEVAEVFRAALAMAGASGGLS
jgi:hypothetical protein